ncbi:hypothetical protein RSOLAG1IB_12132 [Rhizoctonia solani AG-1 IB]|uniref:Uncharacterized protein n=1 Tax=Thanatephorus cucumeris (strain AG1-IB / isolate 7/3/14) TaxID=1108050 RepID=A0A0B7FQG8_THACB|nr:hypothetical protein RSOLAG1IB_12132 [Rhizoctonia solani AG-1 IB]
MAKAPTVTNMVIQDLVDRYSAANFISSVTDFLTRRVRVARHDILLSERNEVNIWHKLFLFHSAPSFAPFDPVRRDVVRAGLPTRRDPGFSDVALILEKPSRHRSENDVYEKYGLDRYRAGRVRVFFTLPAHLRFFYPGQLAYLELFAPFNASVSPFNRLHSTKPDLDARGIRSTVVVPVSDIVFACHLVPQFEKLDPELELHAYTDLLSISRHFWLNHYYNHHFFRPEHGLGLVQVLEEAGLITAFKERPSSLLTYEGRSPERLFHLSTSASLCSGLELCLSVSALIILHPVMYPPFCTSRSMPNLIHYHYLLSKCSVRRWFLHTV